MSKIPKNSSKLNQNIIAAGITSLFTDISSEMIKPILPLFLANTLGVSKSTIGLIEGIAEGASSLFKVISGWLSDKLKKRKNIILFGYSLSNFTKPLISITQSWQQVLFLYFLDRSGKGIRGGPRDALIADSSAKEIRGKAFGFHRTLDTIGAIIGPLLTYILLSRFLLSYRTIFAVTFIPGIIALLVIRFRIKDVPSKKENFKLTFSEVKNIPHHFYYFLFISFIFTLGNSSDAFIILRAENIGVSIYVIPLLYLLFNLSQAIFSLPAGIVSDWIGRKKIISLGFLIFSSLYFILAFIKSVGLIWFVFIMYGLYYAFTEGVQRAFITDLVSPSIRATALGLYNFGIGIAVLLANLIAGFLWEIINPQATFLFGFSFSLLASVLMLFWKYKE